MKLYSIVSFSVLLAVYTHFKKKSCLQVYLSQCSCRLARFQELLMWIQSGISEHKALKSFPTIPAYII